MRSSGDTLQAGANAAAVFAFPGQVAVAISFYKIASILKYSKAVMLEGDVRLATWTDEVIGTSVREHSGTIWSGTSALSVLTPVARRIRRASHAPLPSWSVALRRVRGWLDPWTCLGRRWQARSGAPPPPQLQTLLDHVFIGRSLQLYLLE